MQTPSNPQSCEEFVRNLSKSGLFSQEDLHRTLNDLSEDSTVNDVSSLARKLTDAGKLTPYQAEAVLKHRFEDLLLGNYEVLDKLGGGGMGMVYKARHRRMKRVVALKVLNKSALEDPSFLQRFQREVETIARLTHPNIVMAYDADEADCGPFLVMEFVSGRDLASRVQSDGTLSIHDCVDCILQAARGLAYAHSQGMVHRDIKPANLMQDAGGVVKVADMGLARFNESLGQNSSVKVDAMTQAGSVLGTVDYMAPEQAVDSTAIDHRADIYSLGCTLYFLLTGHPPFVGQSLMATLIKHREAPIPSLCLSRPEAPAALDALYRRMMGKRPTDRPESMQEVVTSLERILQILPGKSATGNVPPAIKSPSPVIATTVIAPSPLISEPPPQSLTSTSLQPQAETNVGLNHASGPMQDASPSSQFLTLGLILAEPSRAQSAIVKNYLHQLGLDVVHVATSLSGVLDLMRRLHPTVVLSAMHLSDGTGIELAQRIKVDPTITRCGMVIITSESDAQSAEELQGLSHVVLLHKPFDLRQLKDALKRAAVDSPLERLFQGS